jgi:hypothetical protein
MVWVAMKLVYLAHRVSGDVEANLRSARAWYQKLTRAYLNEIGFVADWLLWCELLDDGDPQLRAAGLRFDEALVRRCHEFWAVGPGPGLSPGMLTEATVAYVDHRPVRVLTDEDVGRDGRFTEMQLCDGAARAKRWIG